MRPLVDSQHHLRSVAMAIAAGVLAAGCESASLVYQALQVAGLVVDMAEEVARKS